MSMNTNTQEINYICKKNAHQRMNTIVTKNYSIEIGNIDQSSFAEYITTHYSKSKIVIIVDENTHEHCLEFLITSYSFLEEAEVMLLPPGEENKVLEVCFQVWEAMTEYGIGRADLVINLGGGVVTDMGGFIASIFKRGVDFINIPTTLLGMVDASIGGKTGVDLGTIKNQLGVFKNPKAVYVDARFLNSLPTKEIVNGFAEMLKHALIQNPMLWNRLKSVEDLAEIMEDEVLKSSIEIKVNIIREDPHEIGLRKILNFGHTVGHAMEGYFMDKDAIDHGHAVALGIIAESYISYKLELIEKSTFDEIERLILDWFPLHGMDSNDVTGIVDYLRHDKKNHSGKIQCCLLTAIGQCKYDVAVEEHLFIESLLYLVNLNVSLN